MGLSNEYPNTVPAKLGKLIDVNGNDISFQISDSGGSVNLATGITNNNGFYVAVTGDEGVLKVKLYNNNTEIILPFFNGWNPVLITAIVVDGGNTATGVYWGR